MIHVSFHLLRGHKLLKGLLTSVDKAEDSFQGEMAVINDPTTTPPLSDNFGEFAFVESASEVKMMQCPDCPDGYVWNANGPTSKECKTCKGTAMVPARESGDGETMAEPFTVENKGTLETSDGEKIEGIVINEFDPKTGIIRGTFKPTKPE